MDINKKKTDQADKPVRHIIALSGGKDSSALAVYMRGKIKNVEYVFCDTGEELKETYEFIRKLQDYLCTDITWLKSERDFRYYVDLYNGVLPDARTRWCTRMLKLKPYEDFIGDDPVISYVGIRADEPHRKGYISTKPNITTVFPFVEDNIRRDDVMRILINSGLGLPQYYAWRSRSGCYMCFFQQKREWAGLLENHPDLFEKAKSYEKFDPATGERYTWIHGESLDELAHPDRITQIKLEYEKRKSREANAFKGNLKLKDIWDGDLDDSEELACTICHL
ncbi:MAG: phosphoadenosine phosphosulfate reductase family protein [Anaerolineales bacterium]|uniref:Phosphoadenosine phosphosulfate reductase family protein n=1 Tax=Candidatus Desulfolinea nitratireducens TaxID=2841698 RepID=A0A8J6TFN6_9CHLR|nr:phosphoadenosine phosphosulfate reductase family protein [Candidatus Desulfolinea nitratireducens]